MNVVEIILVAIESDERLLLFAKMRLVAYNYLVSPLAISKLANRSVNLRMLPKPSEASRKVCPHPGVPRR